MNNSIVRQDYISKLIRFKGTNDTVKVITGMRRCGKTSILEDYINHLKNTGVPSKDIVYLDFAKRSGQRLENTVMIEGFFAGRISKEVQTYVFFNNITLVDNWVRGIFELISYGNCDIYITESNIMDVIGPITDDGRRINVEEIKIYPLSFKEYLKEFPSNDIDKRFNDYATYGALPEVNPDMGERKADGTLEGIFNTILLNDFVLMKNGDPHKLIRVAKYLYMHIGRELTIYDIAEGCRLSSRTVEKNVNGLEEAYLICRADRYDINVDRRRRGQRFKIYASDIGIRNFALRYDMEISIPIAAENIVYLELKRRGFKVREGSFHETASTFTAIKGDNEEFYQVLSSVKDRGSCNTENVIDNSNMTIITLDRNDVETCGKSKVVHICDWLLQ